MKLAICDDQLESLRQVEAIVRDEWAKNRGQLISIRTFSGAQALLEEAKQMGGFDVYILDVVMPEMDGIRLGLQLRQAGLDGKIIYLTSSQEYAVDSYRVKAYNYLLKPVVSQDLSDTLDEIYAQRKSSQEKQILVKTKESSVRLSLENIMYVQLYKRAAVYHLTDGRTVQSVTLRTTFPEAMKELLAEEQFVMCSQSMAANLQHLTMVETETLVFQDTEQVYLGVKKCRDLRSVWSAYWFRGEDYL